MSVVASALQKAGHDICQFDFLANNKSLEVLQKEIGRFEPDFIGISLRNIDNVDSTAEDGWYLNHVKNIVQSIKDYVTVPVILGGPAFSILPTEILKYTGADFGVCGEGEKAVCSLVTALETGNIPLEKIVKHDSALVGADVHFPLYDPDIMAFYTGHSGMINFQTKRGCPYSCSYCDRSVFQKSFRYNSAQYLVDHLKYLKDTFGIKHIIFYDDQFTFNRKRIEEFSSMMIDNQLDMTFNCAARAEHLDFELLKLIFQVNQLFEQI
jgi:radical SAM superfamily enzyme YgiQ (UPF0313 family)